MGLCRGEDIRENLLNRKGQELILLIDYQRCILYFVRMYFEQLNLSFLNIFYDIFCDISLGNSILSISNM